MNHGVSVNPRDRSFFPLVEFRDAAIWFARQGDLVVAPVGSGYGASAIDIAERGLYGPSPMPASRPTSPTESGRTLAVEVVDSNILSVTTSLPVGQFASIRQGAPVQAFDQAIDE
jgi:hypothetical protein